MTTTTEINPIDLLRATIEAKEAKARQLAEAAALAALTSRFKTVMVGLTQVEAILKQWGLHGSYSLIFDNGGMDPAIAFYVEFPDGYSIWFWKDDNNKGWDVTDGTGYGDDVSTPEKLLASWKQWRIDDGIDPSVCSVCGEPGRGGQHDDTSLDREGDRGHFYDATADLTT